MEAYYILLGVYMFFGLLIFEWAWAQIKVLREINEERDSKYPPFRRFDAYKWRKYHYYFGAITFMPLRFLISVLSVLMCFVFVK